MAAFIGKWKQDEFDPKDMTDFFNAAGIPEDLAKESFKVRIIWEIKQEGEKWHMTVTTTTEPIKSKSYEFIPGEPYESTDLFGRQFKMVTEIISDTKLKETCTEWSESSIDIVREVNGDKMTNNATCKGVSMSMSFTRM